LGSGRKARDEVGGAPDLERARTLEVLGLEGDGTAEQPAEGRRAVEGCGPDHTGHSFLGLADLLQRDHGVTQARLSRLARPPTEGVRVRTYSPKPADIQRAWHVVDADGLVLGRLATEVATI